MALSAIDGHMGCSARHHMGTRAARRGIVLCLGWHYVMSLVPEHGTMAYVSCRAGTASLRTPCRPAGLPPLWKEAGRTTAGEELLRRGLERRGCASRRVSRACCRNEDAAARTPMGDEAVGDGREREQGGTW